MDSDKMFSVFFEGQEIMACFRLKNPACKDVWVVLHGLLHHMNSVIETSLADGLSVNTCRVSCLDREQSNGIYQYGGHDRWRDQTRLVVEHLREIGYRVVGIIGHSKGSNVSLLYHMKYFDEQVKYLVLLAARSNLGTFAMKKHTEDKIDREGFATLDMGKGRLLKTTREDLEYRRGVDMSVLKDVASIQRVFAIHGSEDRIVDCKQSWELAEIVGKERCDVCVLQGANHNYDGFLEDVVGKIDTWIRERSM